MCGLQRLRLSSSHIKLGLQSHGTDDLNINIDGLHADAGAEPSSACLWAMVDNFLEDTYTPAANCEEHPLGNICASSTLFEGAIQEMESLLGERSAQVDTVKAKIARIVAKALESCSHIIGGESAHNEQALPAVIEDLRRAGYDAGLRVTGRKPGGHRYIDVILEEESAVSSTRHVVRKRSSEKLIVDVGFPAHFEIARPSPAYQKLMHLLPSIFIEKSTLLQRVVRIMSQAAKASLESQSMYIPPWRSFSFLLAKWLSPSCSRITSLHEVKHIVCAPPEKLSVLAELDYLADSPGFEGVVKSFFLREEDAPTAWRPPPSSQIPVSHDRNDTSRGYTPKRRQARVVSALALAFAKTQVTHNMCAAAGA